MNDTIRIAGLYPESVVDGPGIRFVVFTQGCPYACPHCHNKDTWDIKGGSDMLISDIITKWRTNPLIDGITFSGGEPLLQKEKLLPLINAALSDDLNITLFTGSTYEELVSRNDVVINEILNKIHYLIDGPYVHTLQDLTLLYRGSKNQRIIDIQKTKVSGKIITVNKFNECN